jgi:hypothetical protein
MGRDRVGGRHTLDGEGQSGGRHERRGEGLVPHLGLGTGRDEQMAQG